MILVLRGNANPISQSTVILPFALSGGLIFGIVNIVGNFGTVFCDQAYWQSSVAAKPLQVSTVSKLRVILQSVRAEVCTFVR